MPDEVWAENDLLPDRKVKMTVQVFKVRRQNGWRLTDPPPPPDPKDEADIEKAVAKAAKSSAGKKPAPVKPDTTTKQKKATKSSTPNK